MPGPVAVLGFLLIGAAFGAVGFSFYQARKRASNNDNGITETSIPQMIRDHFHPTALDQMTITERKFPFRVRADLQQAIDQLFNNPVFNN